MGGGAAAAGEGVGVGGSRHVAGGSHDVGRHVTESHAEEAEAPGEAAGRPPPPPAGPLSRDPRLT